MRCFNYSECENIDKLFKYLDEYLDEGFINYTINRPEEEILIENLTIDDDDELYTILIKKYDILEDDDYEDFSDDYEDYEDFYDSDNLEDY